MFAYNRSALASLALLITAFAVTFANVHDALGALITGVTVEQVSSEFGGREAIYTINSGGCAGCDTDINSGTHVATPTNGTMWHNADGQASGLYIVYDLGAVYTVDQWRVWNHNSNEGTNENDRGIRGVVIRVSNTDTAITGAVPAGPFTTLTTSELAIATGAAGYTGTLYSESFTGRYFRIDSTSSWGDTGYRGLSEIRFNEAEAPPVPEPSTYALGLIGLAGLGMAIWRKRKSFQM